MGIVTKLPSQGSRIIFRLLWDIAPLACENFATLCTNGGNSLDSNCSGSKKNIPAPVGESGKELTYRNSSIHRVVPKFIVQGGDFVFGNGSGGESIYNGKKFKDERAGLGMKHDKAGVLSMGNSGKNSNTSQFFITLDKAPQCDGKHVVFGEVISGIEVVRAIESFGTSSGEPTVPILITDCGAYTPLMTPSAGSWYDRPDSDSYTGITPEFMVRPRAAIIAPTKTVTEKFRSALGDHATTFLISVDEVGDENLNRVVMEMLQKFALDVVLAAPACAKLFSTMDIPQSWKDASKSCPPKEDVFLVSKPVDALSTLIKNSWLCKQSGWILSGSFE
mmetsp:Transcript_2700/g.5218  ORF Transcript_2700/g.5218 Transcript_2700/m.5218 type:complete len:334 (+) Transcript_2700:244-1245(+)